MKVSSWQDIIISWANALRLVDHPITDVLDLVKGSFFIKLLNKTKKVERDGDSSFSEDYLYNVIENFLKDEFSGFRLLGYWDNDEVTLVASVMLLWSSLESQSCRTPLYELDESVQIKIQAFIQRFIETPQHLINRQLVMDAVLDITFDSVSEDESLNFSTSPRTYSTPKRPSANTSNFQSPACLALSEMRSLRSKVDLLNCEKQHLQEELEVTKSQLSDMKVKLKQKDAELMRLTNHIACEDKDVTVEEKLSSYNESKNSTESSLVKMELEELKDIVNKLRQDLESTIDENSNLIHLLSEEKRRRVESEQKCEEVETRNISLSNKLAELEMLTSSLKKTCEEQSLFLAEKMKPAEDESLRLSDCETLGGIVDIKYSELEEELKLSTELLEEKRKEVEDLILAKENDNSTIKLLQADIKRLKTELENYKKGTLSCPNCEVLKDKLTTSQINYTSKIQECEKVKAELSEKTDRLNKLEKSKSQIEMKVVDLLKEKAEIINDYTVKIDDLKEELLSLQCEMGEKNNAISFYRDETDFLNKCLSGKSVELKCLEKDHNKISKSKDREISQLMVTIEHLNKEVNVLREKLEAECGRQEAVADARLRLQDQATANQETARELIALHESLQWKTLKIGDLSLQIDQLRSEITDKETLNKELHQRLVFLSERNREVSRELHTSKNTIAHLQSTITSLEYKERRLNQELVKKNQKFEVVDYELKELWKLLKQKFNTIDLEMDTCMLSGKPDLQDIVKYIDFMCEKLKENRRNISHLTVTINELEADNAEKTAELEMFENRVEKLSSDSSTKVVEQWMNENTFFQDHLRKIETDYENSRIKLQDTLKKLEEANENLKSKDLAINDFQSEVKRLNEELKEKLQLIECLQQNINLYEHEKSILKKKLTEFSHNSDKTHCCNNGNSQTQSEVNEEWALSSVGGSSSANDRVVPSFNEKMFDLQSKMKAQYDDKLQKVVEEYTKKIDQLKVKVKKDSAHIEHLSSELWETSDRLLLAQQEAEALRSQLKRTNAILSEQNNRGTEDCSSFMWLGGADGGNFVEEFVTTVSSKRKVHRPFPSSTGLSNEFEVEDDMFNQQYLEDLKAGICRLPSPIGRLSCPAESTRIEEDSNFLAPSGKPRKLKGSIMYRKPGPPTPSISAARHSLPGNERLELRKGLREQNTNIHTGKSRLSQIFGSITLSKPKTVQESPNPKAKRKGFFQRTFGNRENLPPKM